LTQLAKSWSPLLFQPSGLEILIRERSIFEFQEVTKYLEETLTIEVKINVR
jgi:hypothetical protein